MNEVFLALLAFGLGVLTTFLTQMISRRFRFADARRKSRLVKLERIRVWMAAYRTLFRCEYPEINELIFANEYLNTQSVLYNKKAKLWVYESLKKYRDADIALESAERNGREALEDLGENWWFTRMRYRLGLIFSRSLYSTFQYGFPRSIAPYLGELHEQKYNLFEGFPKWSAKLSIDWNRLDHVTPDEVHQLIHSRLGRWTDERQSEALNSLNSEQVANAADARDQLFVYRNRAETAIEQILDVVRRYESKWILPESSA